MQTQLYIRQLPPVGLEVVAHLLERLKEQARQAILLAHRHLKETTVAMALARRLLMEAVEAVLGPLAAMLEQPEAMAAQELLRLFLVRL